MGAEDALAGRWTFASVMESSFTVRLNDDSRTTCDVSDHRMGLLQESLAGDLSPKRDRPLSRSLQDRKRASPTPVGFVYRSRDISPDHVVESDFLFGTARPARGKFDNELPFSET